MATVHTNLTVGKTYAVTSTNGCTVTLANGVEVTLQAGQDYFTPDTPDVTVSDDAATVVQTFNHAPARRGGGGEFDGHLDADLHVGEEGGEARHIYVNGVELFGESTVVVDAVEANNANAVTSNAVWNAIQAAAPHAPTPTPLGSTTTLLHGRVYTLAVAEDTDLSALGVEQYGTAELWIDYTAGSVDFTGTGWVWVPDGDAPASFTAGKRYCIALRNDGTATLANLQYEYTTPAQS